VTAGPSEAEPLAGPDELLDLLADLGRQPSCEGRGLSELDHLLQCAELLARRHPEDSGLQLAGLVHDVGHRFGSDAEHGRLGAAMVGPVLGERVALLVDAHVAAKRYLVTVDPAYRAGLSEDSLRTLALQGGPMARHELDSFAAAPWSEDALALRRADDAAKVPGLRVPGLARWSEVVAAQAAAARREASAATDPVAGSDGGTLT